MCCFESALLHFPIESHQTACIDTCGWFNWAFASISFTMTLESPCTEDSIGSLKDVWGVLFGHTGYNVGTLWAPCPCLSAHDSKQVFNNKKHMVDGNRGHTKIGLCGQKTTKTVLFLTLNGSSHFVNFYNILFI